MAEAKFTPHAGYYVYTHRRATTGEIFYVGKGVGGRAWEAQCRPQKWQDIAEAGGYEIHIERSALTETEAFNLEKELISNLSKLNAPLVNVQHNPPRILAVTVENDSSFEDGKAQLKLPPMATSVQRKGNRYQLRVQHRLLPRRFWFSFATEEEARAYGRQLARLLDAGIVPSEFANAPPAHDEHIGEIIQAYMDTAPGVAPSDAAQLKSMLSYTSVRWSQLTYQWAEAYVGLLKSRRLAPGTIRKCVGSLARVVDWHLRRTGSDASNSLRLLPKGYSNYAHDQENAPRDTVRDRRLAPGEADAIVPLLPEQMAQLFHVLVWTGLRLREAYKLRVDQIDTQKWIIKVEGSKGARGALKPRAVPIVPELRPMFAEMIKGRVGRLWGFWDGDPATLDACTARLSYQFRHHFERAGITDLVAHDLRHEACCRWVERRDAKGRWVFSEIEVARIMGWSSLRMMMRYASIRGEDLSARLG